MATAGQGIGQAARGVLAGLVISCRAYFGLGPQGTPDAGRVRDISVAVSPSHAAAIIATQEEGATESELHDAAVEAIADAISVKAVMAVRAWR